MIKGACKGDEYCNGDTCFSPTVFNPNEKEYLTCVCKPGFKRDESGNCVEHCKPPCSDPLEIHKFVKDDCNKEAHCNPGDCASIMPVNPTWTCACKPGTFRHEGKCCTECPTQCGANEDPVDLYCPCNERYCSNKGIGVKEGVFSRLQVWKWDNNLSLISKPIPHLSKDPDVAVAQEWNLVAFVKKDLFVMAITNVFQNILTVHHHATTLMKNSKCVPVIKNVISQRSRFLNQLFLGDRKFCDSLTKT